MTTIEFAGEVWNWLLADPSHVVVLASAVVAVTGTPDPSTRLGKAYSVLEVLALNAVRAKETGVVAAADKTTLAVPRSPSLLPGTLSIDPISQANGGANG